MSVMLSAASALTWAARQLAFEDEASLLACAAQLPLQERSTAPLFLPYLSGERTPHNQPLATACWFGLTAAHGREAMAYAVAEGAREAGATVDIKRVPETVPLDVAKAAHFKLDQDAPIATVAELADYDAIIIGVGTRFGRMASQMAAFLDQAGGLWAKGALHGKVGGAFTSTATQHGGQESTILGFIPTMLHHGMVVVGLPYTWAGQSGVDEIRGGSPYGASTIADCDGSRQPSKVELDGARFQGKHIAEIAAKLAR